MSTMRLYRVSTWRLDMYEGREPLVLPARSQRTAIALARILAGPGNWRAHEVHAGDVLQ